MPPAKAIGKDEETREPKPAGLICLSCSRERLCRYCTKNVAHTPLGSTPTGTVSQVPLQGTWLPNTSHVCGSVGGPSSVLQSDVGNGVSPTSPSPTASAQLWPSGVLGVGFPKTHPISFSCPGGGFVVDDVLHAKPTVIAPSPTDTPT